MKIAIQGQRGSFHAQVAQAQYPGCQLVECQSFGDVFDAYKNRQADAIVTAVENTVYGSINEVYQLIATSDVPIVGEVKLTIAQHLIAHPAAVLSDITTIYSHPVALAQCHDSLAHLCPNAQHIEYSDTAAAVEYVKSLDDPTAAAIGSHEAAELYGLPIIKADVHDSRANITRFLLLEPSKIIENPDRASLTVTTPHHPGALLEVLQVFSNYDINLAKLQSQPIVGQPWNYQFFIVVDQAGELLHKCLDELTASQHQVKLLGEYKADL